MKSNNEIVDIMILELHDVSEMIGRIKSNLETMQEKGKNENNSFLYSGYLKNYQQYVGRRIELERLLKYCIKD